MKYFFIILMLFVTVVVSEISFGIGYDKKLFPDSANKFNYCRFIELPVH